MLHVFQPFPLEDLKDFDPIKLIHEEGAVLTTVAEGKINAMTVTWGSMGFMWGKKVIQVYVRDSRLTKQLLDKCDVFSLTFFDEKYKTTLKYIAAVSGRVENKIKNANLKINLHKEIPFIDEGNFVILCKKLGSIPMPLRYLSDEIIEQFYPNGDPQTMYVGEIIETMAR